MGFSSLGWLIRFSLVALLAAPVFAEGSHDRTQFGHDITVGSEEKVAERIRRDSQALVGGDITTFAGGAGLWLFIIFGLPFLVLGALIALIVWLIRRSKRPVVPMAARI